ncbi:MAG TPA: hypothetical protein VH079_00100 [Terriglobales bacterium]|jgi:hypothetical protein|nr:hypothetical protein [Terriglobales bacterium]
MDDQTHYSVFFCSICTLPVVIKSRTAKIDDLGRVAHEGCRMEPASKPWFFYNFQRGAPKEPDRAR